LKIYNNVSHFVQNTAELNVNNANSELQLQPGDIIQAEAIEANVSQNGDNYVLLCLKNGSKIKAAVENGVTIAKGELLNFIVKDMSEGNILLKILSSDSNISPASKLINTDESLINILKELADLRITLDKNILNIASELKLQGFALTKTSLMNASAMLSQMPDLTVENAVFAAGSGISPNTPLNTSMIDFSDGIVAKDINMLLNREIDLSYKISSISGMIDNVIDEMQQVSSQVLHESLNFNGSDISISDAAKYNANGKQSVNNSYDSNKLLVSNIVDKSDTMIIEQLKDIKVLLDNNYIDIKNISAFIANFNELYESGKEIENEQFFQHIDLKDTYIDFKDTNDIVKQAEFEKTILGRNQLGKSNEVISQFGKQIANSLANIKDNIDTLMNVLSVINTPLSQQLQQNINEVQRNINMLLEFNKFINFWQVPLKIGDFRTNAQLYVLNRKKAKSLYKSEGYTAFISLETFNLGRFDSIINIKNKTVNINISLPGKEQADFIKQNISSLIASIENLGFKAGDIRVKSTNASKSLPQIHKEMIKNYIYPKSMLDLRI